MPYYKVMFPSNHKTEQVEIENFAESTRSTLEDSSKFSVFSVTIEEITTI